MQPFTKADEDSVRITNEALADLARLGAVLVDPGPQGQLFKDAIAELVPPLDSTPLVSTFQELFAASDLFIVYNEQQDIERERTDRVLALKYSRLFHF